MSAAVEGPPMRLFGFHRPKKKFRQPSSKPRLAARLAGWFLRLLVLTVALAVFALAGWIGCALYGFMFRSPYFEYGPSEIFIRFEDDPPTGDERAIEHQVMRRLRWKKMQAGNLLALDPEAFGAEVESHPKIKSAAVRKIYPNMLEVGIRQRKAVAFFVQDGIIALDREGIVIEVLSPRDPRTLGQPFIGGYETARLEPGGRIQSESLTKALRLLLCLRDKGVALYPRISEAYCDKEQELTLVLKGGTKIRFGKADPILKMPALETFIRKMGEPEEFEYIDLRLDGQVPAMPKRVSAPGQPRKASSP